MNESYKELKEICEPVSHYFKNCLVDNSLAQTNALVKLQEAVWWAEASLRDKQIKHKFDDADISYDTKKTNE